jgi:hypothetical protein
MGMWKRSGKRGEANHNVGPIEEQKRRTETESKEGDDQTQNPVRAGMRKWKMEDKESNEEAEKRIEQAALTREFERGVAGGASNFV